MPKSEFRVELNRYHNQGAVPILGWVPAKLIGKYSWANTRIAAGDIDRRSIDIVARAKPGSKLQLDGIDASGAVTAVGLRGMAAAITRLAIINPGVGKDFVTS
jgi:hypothetical protein